MMNKDMVFSDAIKKMLCITFFYIFYFNSKKEIFKFLK